MSDEEQFFPFRSDEADKANRAMPTSYKLAPVDCGQAWNILKGNEWLKIDGRIRAFGSRKEAIEYAWQHAGLGLEVGEHVPEFVYRK